MKPTSATVSVALLLLSSLPRLVSAQSGSETPRTTIGGQWFLNDRAGEVDGEDVHQFGVDRGYIVIRHRLTDRISGRITPDVTVDREGDGQGDLKVRLKYAYADFQLPNIAVLTEPHVEFGLVHRPWLDFEEHLNYYRMQGTMFTERNGLFNSADYGITLFAELGGRLDAEYRERVNARYPGKYGSVAVGVYNGGGYHAIEQNVNKSLEGRVTLRPLPEVLPGFQVSYHGILGKGNSVDRPDWTVNQFMVSWESVPLVVAGQYYRGRGDSRGSAVDAAGDALRQSGYSVFAEVRLPVPVSVLGRYDYFDPTPDTDGGEEHRVISGVAYHLRGHSKVLIDLDALRRDGRAVSTLVKAGIEFSF